MNLKVKKIIAKEFLLFILLISILIVVFLGLFIYNSVQKNKSKKIGEQIILNLESANKFKTKFDSLQQKYNHSTRIVNSFTKEGLPVFDTSKTIYYLKEVDRKRLDSILNKYDGSKDVIAITNIVKEFKLAYGEELEPMTNNDSISYYKYIDLSNIIKSQKQLQQNCLNKIVLSNEIFAILKMVFVVGFTIIFIFRYIVLAVLLSFKILKK